MRATQISALKRIALVAVAAAMMVVLPLMEQASSANNELQIALSGNQQIDRATYLRLLVRSETERDGLDDALLISALGRRESLWRRLAAFQLGESEHPDAHSVAALVLLLTDDDEGVALQAAAALRSVAYTHPDLIAAHLTALDSVRGYEYRSQRANQFRHLRLRISDFAIAALAGAPKGAILPVVAAYRAAKARGPGATGTTSAAKQPQLSSGEADQYLPGEPRYYLLALRVLAARSGGAEPELILDLMNDPDSDLRSTARALTPFLGAVAARAIPALKAAASAEPDIAERQQAVRILATLGDAGRAEVESLRVDGNAAAFASPGERSDCSSQAVATGIRHADPAARMATVRGLGWGRSDFDYACLAPLVPDTSLDAQTRERAAALVGISAAPDDASRREQLALMLLSALQSGGDQLDWEIKRSVAKILHDHRSSNAALVAAIRARIAAGSQNSEIVCLVRTIDPELLRRDHDLARQIAGLYLNEHEISGEARTCLAASLDELGDADLRRVLPPDVLLRKLANSEYVSKAEEMLLARLVDRTLLTARRGELLAGKKDLDRLQVADLLARRGVVSGDVLAEFINALNTKVVLNRWHMVNAAAVGLAHAGAPGLTILKKIVRGDGFSRDVTVDVLGQFYWIDPGARRALRNEVLAATRGADPVVRAAAASDLHYMFDDPTELSAELERLGADRDDRVVKAVIDSRRDDKSTAAPPLALIARAARATDHDLRSRAAESLPLLPKPLSGEALTIARALLVDNDAWVRAEALNSVAMFGADGAELLRAELSGPNAERLVSSGKLAYALFRIGAPASIVEVPLIELARKGGPKANILDALGALNGASQGTINFVTDALAEEDAEVRKSAISAIVALRPDPATLPERAFAALLDSELVHQYRLELNKVLEAIRPYFGSVPLSGPIVTLPDFPWPPPAWSSKTLVPKDYLGGDTARLGDVTRTLIEALAAASPDYEYGLFGNVPGGFALLARLERIHPDGQPYLGLERWSERDEPVAGLRDYIAHLFLAVPGYYRIIAFVVTNQDGQAPGNGKLPDMRIGGKSLPEDIAALTMDGRECLALIYTYRRYRGGQIAFGYDGAPSGQTQLTLAGIWPALANRLGAR